MTRPIPRKLRSGCASGQHPPSRSEHEVDQLEHLGKLGILIPQSIYDDDVDYSDFSGLFDPTEGRIGVTVTFLAILELLKEMLIDVVQNEPYGPIHVRAAQAASQGKQSEPA